MTLSPRLRKAIGLFLLLLGLGLYCLLITYIADQIDFNSLLTELGFYIAAGVIWLTPAIPLIRWMQNRDFQ